MKLATHFKTHSAHFAFVALAIVIAFAGRLHGQDAAAPAAAENPAAILINNARIFDGTTDELVVGNLLIVGSNGHARGVFQR